MKNKHLVFIAPLLAAGFMTPLLSGCGGREDSTVAKPSAKELSIPLSDDGTVRLDLVKLPNGMWFGKTEVTQAQWEEVAGENPSFYSDRDLPVIDVSWDDSQMFLRRLNALPEIKRTGLVFRLPTSEEWTYACLAGAENDFCRLSDGTASVFAQPARSKTPSVGTTRPRDVRHSTIRPSAGCGRCRARRRIGPWRRNRLGARWR